MEYNKRNLNGWAIGQRLFEWILNNVPKESTILELGSGRGTSELVKFYTVFSVEQDERWVGREPKSNYIHAPLVSYGNNKWYDVNVMCNLLPETYGLLLIDGPKGKNRKNLIDHQHLFKHDGIPVVVDDTDRKWDKWLVDKLAHTWNKNIHLEIEDGRKKSTILL